MCPKIITKLSEFLGLGSKLYSVFKNVKTLIQHKQCSCECTETESAGTGSLKVYTMVYVYIFQFAVFMGFLGMQTSGSLSLCLLLGSFPSISFV